MSRLQKNINGWKYIKTSDEGGRFLIYFKNAIKLQEEICEEISNYRVTQIVKDYMQTDPDGNYYRTNSSSRNFEKSQLYKDMNISEYDIIENLEFAEFLKADIDKDMLTRKEHNDILEGRTSSNNIPVVYIFRCHYYLDDKNDIPIYVKINFGFNRDKNNNIQDCLFIKSVHLDNEKCPSKEIYYKDFDKRLHALPSWERTYKYINEDDYIRKYPEELFKEESLEKTSMQNSRER